MLVLKLYDRPGNRVLPGAKPSVSVPGGLTLEGSAGFLFMANPWNPKPLGRPSPPLLNFKELLPATKKIRVHSEKTLLETAIKTGYFLLLWQRTVLMRSKWRTITKLLLLTNNN